VDSNKQYRSIKNKKAKYIDVLRIDFNLLKDDYKELDEDSATKTIASLEKDIEKKTAELKTYNPNLKAKEKFKSLEDKIALIDKEIDEKLKEGTDIENDYIRAKKRPHQHVQPHV